MNWGWIPRTLGILAIASSFVVLWVAFVHPICTVSVPGVSGCVPNFTYLFPSFLVALAGGVVLAVQYQFA